MAIDLAGSADLPRLAAPRKMQDLTFNVKIKRPFSVPLRFAMADLPIWHGAPVAPLLATAGILQRRKRPEALRRKFLCEVSCARSQRIHLVSAGFEIAAYAS